MSTLLPYRLGTYVDCRTCTSAEDVILDNHTASLCQDATCKVTPYGRTTELQAWELRDIEEVILVVILGELAVELHLNIHLLALVLHIDNLGNALDNE